VRISYALLRDWASHAGGMTPMAWATAGFERPVKEPRIGRGEVVAPTRSSRNRVRPHFHCFHATESSRRGFAS
jgi:hypothetical protein